MRLTEIGIERYVTASAVSAVLAQRLVRRLCLHCREPYEASAAELQEWRFPPSLVAGHETVTVYRKRGCDRCSKGYSGRIGIYELMIMDASIRKLVNERADVGELELAARAAGMKTLWEDGTEKVLAGLTTIDELERILG